MKKGKEELQRRFQELGNRPAQPILRSFGESGTSVDPASWQKWSTNALHLIRMVFGEHSVHFKNLQKIHDNYHHYPSEVEAAVGVFSAAKDDFEGGYLFTVEGAITGEILGDFVGLAKACIANSNKNAAAVLASAALEDALKRYAASQGLEVQDKEMQQVVGALKSKGLVSGAQKSLLDTMPKLRDYAMHANWDKLSPEDVNSVIGFVEQFILNKFT